MLPLGGEDTGGLIQSGLYLCAQEAIYRGEKWREVDSLLEARLQILMIIFFFRYLETLLQGPLQAGKGISIHNTHIINTVCNLLSDVLD